MRITIKLPAHVLLMLIASCGGTGADGTGQPLRRPAYDDGFKKVADVLLLGCGTLDCHAPQARNLRVPPISDSSNGEEAYQRIYWSVVGLEPEVLDAVVRERGANPERLTLIRKARGTEKHVGGQVMVKGDDMDRCFLTWIAGKTDEAACMKVFEEINARKRRM